MQNAYNGIALVMKIYSDGKRRRWNMLRLSFRKVDCRGINAGRQKMVDFCYDQIEHVSIEDQGNPSSWEGRYANRQYIIRLPWASTTFP